MALRVGSCWRSALVLAAGVSERFVRPYWVARVVKCGLREGVSSAAMLR